MSSPALAAALADIDTVFNGFASPTETGCEFCFRPEETAFLRTPYTRVPADLIARFLFKDPLHFEDHADVTRRLLPQTAHAMVDGTLDDLLWGPHALSRVNWRDWPADQVAAIEAFVLAWWQDTLTQPQRPYAVTDVFETCAAIAGTVTPFLDAWTPGPVADPHLVRCADVWLYDLVSDCSPFHWWAGDDQDTGVAALRTWLSRPGAARLFALDQPHFAMRASLLALPYEERWSHPYWTSAWATN